MSSSFRKWLVCVFMVLSTTTGFAQTKPDAEVRKAVDAYLHGLKFNDVASLKVAFHPDAKLYWIKKDGAIGQLTQDEWYKGFAASAGKEEAGELSITAVDITGDIASVKVVENYATSRYTDYLSLLRTTGGWKIINKIYQAEKR